MSSNMVLTFMSDLADVSHSTSPCSSAYACASSVDTWQWCVEVYNW